MKVHTCHSVAGTTPGSTCALPPQHSRREPLSPLPHLQRLHGGFFSSKYTICTACGRRLLRQTKRSPAGARRVQVCAALRTGTAQDTFRAAHRGHRPPRHEGDASLWPSSLEDAGRPAQPVPVPVRAGGRPAGSSSTCPSILIFHIVWLKTLLLSPQFLLLSVSDHFLLTTTMLFFMSQLYLLPFL